MVRNVSISFSHEIIWFQVGILWDAICIGWITPESSRAAKRRPFRFRLRGKEASAQDEHELGDAADDLDALLALEGEAALL